MDSATTYPRCPSYQTRRYALLKRDIEARLAGILTYYHIPAAALADRLHVAYLAEVDPRVYALAQMADDVAVLNTRMLGWLRDYPDIIAVFVDPLAA